MNTYDHEPQPRCCDYPRHKIFGVCARIAHILECDVSLVRLATVVLAFLLPGFTILVYCILGLIL
ncbi:MAG: PspC domain-containing protein [Legionellales bacterium]|nr:PspC domain-containing protein [Legionellales bacterium]